uniref:Fibronectin type-III domain-containing protein n=1 Tax=Clytia hemisphaerica TaxID=252671 RepID=A0A7M5XAU1_9CNID
MRQTTDKLFFWAIITATFAHALLVDINCRKGTILYHGKCILYTNSFYRGTGVSNNELYRKCGNNSQSNVNRTRCICYPGYIRLPEHNMNSSSPCCNPSPQNLYIKQTSSSSLHIQWETSKELTRKVKYLIQCQGPYELQLRETRNTFAIFTNLTRDTLYSITIKPRILGWNNLRSSKFEFSLKDIHKYITTTKKPDYVSKAQRYRQSTLKHFLVNFIPPTCALILIICMVVRMYQSRSRRRAVMRKYHIVKEQQQNGGDDEQFFGKRITS